MSKTKFVLTEDLIEIESKKLINNKEKIAENVGDKKERISLNINSVIKKDLHLYCVHNKKKMTDIIELSIKEYLNKNYL